MGLNVSIIVAQFVKIAPPNDKMFYCITNAAFKNPVFIQFCISIICLATTSAMLSASKKGDHFNLFYIKIKLNMRYCIKHFLTIKYKLILFIKIIGFTI